MTMFKIIDWCIFPAVYYAACKYRHDRPCIAFCPILSIKSAMPCMFHAVYIHNYS